MNHSKVSREKKRFVVVGLGGRTRMFLQAIGSTYKDRAEVVAFCDTNQVRMDYHRERMKTDFGVDNIASYPAADFDRMLAETKPDTVIVTSIDRTHHDYIVRGMEAGCDVITEKPMTTDIEKCRAILDASKRTGRDLRVTFNYRYAPNRTKVKELLMNKEIGEVTSVHFEWLLNTRHGADYFRRWHRDKRNSGGLMVHKSTHHFDLLNWWLDSQPDEVFGMGKLAFYGRANAEARGEHYPYHRTLDVSTEENPFALNLRDGGDLEALYLNAEKDDGYLRDQNVFGDGISIEDTMNVMVRYRNKVQLTYSLTAYAPWEGYRIAFNGTEGRIELEEVENSYVNAGGDGEGEGSTSSSQLRLCKHWEKPQIIEVEKGVGGHGGGDNRLLEDLFGDGNLEDPLGRAAGPIDGALSILTGIAANQSFETGLPVKVDSLLQL